VLETDIVDVYCLYTVYTKDITLFSDILLIFYTNFSAFASTSNIGREAVYCCCVSPTLANAIQFSDPDTVPRLVVAALLAFGLTNASIPTS
jgi:hypothetical protein